MTALELFTTLRASGVVLAPMVDRVRVDAPKGALTPALRTALQAHKTALLDLVEVCDERAAIAEYCGGVPRADAETLAWHALVEQEALEVSP